MIVIFGAGHVGGRLARLLIGSESVRVTTRRADRLQALAALGVEVVEARLDEPESLSAALEGAERAVYTMAPGRSGDPSGVYGDGLRCLVELARRRGIGRFVLCSSTAVYDREDDGGFVDEQTAVAPETARAERLFEAERVAREALGERLGVVRLAGLYERGRGPFQVYTEALREGRALPGSGQRCLSVIHADDAASRLATALEQPRLELMIGVDEAPRTRGELYGAYARSKALPPPLFSEHDGPRRGRRCRSRLDLPPLRFPTLEDALESERA